MRRLFVPLLALLLPVAALAQNPAITDPPRDAAHPPQPVAFVLKAPDGAGAMNALLWQAGGAGAHPTLLLFHGFPGNEQNLDLAQAARRAGWHVLTLHYRGSWGSPGEFHFRQVPEDAAAVIAWLRQPEVAAKLGIDPARMARVDLERIRARDGDLAIDLELRPLAPPVLQGEDGLSRKSAEPGNVQRAGFARRLWRRWGVWYVRLVRASRIP